MQGDWIEQLRTLPAESVQCVPTSPPYWALRDYKLPKSEWPECAYSPMPGLAPITVPAWTGCLGLEPTPEMFVAHIVLGFREIHRVLRKDGTVWMNFGDCYLSKPFYDGDSFDPKWAQARNRGRNNGPNRKAINGLKQKDLMGIPWRVAFALQAEGWFVRRDIIWAKPNCMPESTTDRPTTAHEYIFLLTKSPKYFYDAEAIKEKSSPKTFTVNTTPRKGNGTESTGEKLNKWMSENGGRYHPATRNSRSVWRITTRPFKGAHFATFPPEIPLKAIMAGTSEKGACADCGAPWERLVGKSGGTIGQAWHDHSADDHRGQRCSDQAKHHGRNGSEPYKVWTVGWQPSCECHGKFVKKKVVIPARITPEQAAQWGADKNGEYNGVAQKDYPESTKQIQNASEVKARILRNATKERIKTVWVYESDLPLDRHPLKPCMVLDPFGGSGTTGQVALTIGRRCTLIELNADYIELIKKRCYETTTPRSARKIQRDQTPVHATAARRAPKNPNHSPATQTTWEQILEKA